MLNKKFVTDKASPGVKLFNIAKGLENRSKLINSLRYNAKRQASPGVKLFNIAKGLENRSKIINSLRYNAKKTE